MAGHAWLWAQGQPAGPSSLAYTVGVEGSTDFGAFQLHAAQSAWPAGARLVHRLSNQLH